MPSLILDASSSGCDTSNQPMSCRRMDLITRFFHSAFWLIAGKPLSRKAQKKSTIMMRER